MKVKLQRQTMELAEALAPIGGWRDNHDDALICRRLNEQAKAIGAIAARLVELRQWTIHDAAIACGQSGIEHVRDPIGGA